MNKARKKILGIAVDAFTQNELFSSLENALNGAKGITIFAVNAEKIMAARKDKELSHILNEADVLLPDGFGPVVGLRLIHGYKIQRTTGFMLMRKILKMAENMGYKVFIFGARPDVVRSAAENIRRTYRALPLVGFEHGYIPQAEYAALIKRINNTEADILFVGLGSPKQEKWIHQHKKRINAKICMGVGGSIDVIAGKVPIAPVWISNIYMEWVYRLLKQPSRFKRQKVVPLFILKMLKETASSKIQNGR